MRGVPGGRWAVERWVAARVKLILVPRLRSVSVNSELSCSAMEIDWKRSATQLMLFCHKESSAVVVRPLFPFFFLSFLPSFLSPLTYSSLVSFSFVPIPQPLQFSCHTCGPKIPYALCLLSQISQRCLCQLAMSVSVIDADPFSSFQGNSSSASSHHSLCSR